MSVYFSAHESIHVLAMSVFNMAACKKRSRISSEQYT